MELNTQPALSVYSLTDDMEINLQSRAKVLETCIFFQSVISFTGMYFKKIIRVIC